MHYFVFILKETLKKILLKHTLQRLEFKEVSLAALVLYICTRLLSKWRLQDSNPSLFCYESGVLN